MRFSYLVAGEAGWREQWIINHNANKAYEALSSLGFEDSRILYLSSDWPQDAEQKGENFDETAGWFQASKWAEKLVEEQMRKNGNL